MYEIDKFKDKYAKLESWAKTKYREEGYGFLLHKHKSENIRRNARYFKDIRDHLAHNAYGFNKPLIELTDEFGVQFESFCNALMGNISLIYIPVNKVYKREMGDMVLPTISTMKEKAFSYVPVMNGKKVWGVFSESTVFNLVSKGEFAKINSETQMFSLKENITEYSKNGYYDFVRNNATIDDVRRIFSDAFDKGRKLDVLYVTSTGDKNGDLVGLVTIWDLSSQYK